MFLEYHWVVILNANRMISKNENKCEVFLMNKKWKKMFAHKHPTIQNKLLNLKSLEDKNKSLVEHNKSNPLTIPEYDK